MLHLVGSGQRVTMPSDTGDPKGEGEVGEGSGGGEGRVRG